MADPAAQRPVPRGRRRLRTRIIVTFTLLGFCLTALFAFATNWTRDRVENQLVEDMMNQNIDEYARRFFDDPRNVTLPVQQMRGRVVSAENFEALRYEQPDWYRLGDGIHTIIGRHDDGSPFSYKRAVRQTPGEWFFLAYDTTQAVRGQEQFKRWIWGAVVLFTALALVLGWWSASRVMAPVSDLAQRLRRSGA